MTEQRADSRAVPEVQQAADYERLAEMAAQATGKNFLIGVRPEGKGWFAHCDGIEWDGDSPKMAVESVVRGLAERAQRTAIHASADAKSLEQQAIDLADTVQLIDGSPPAPDSHREA